MAARLVFPRDLVGLDHLDTHFLRIRRIVIGILLVLLAVQIGWYASLPELAPRILRPLPLGLTILLATLMILAMAVRNHRWLNLIMGALVARYVLAYLLF